MAGDLEYDRAKEVKQFDDSKIGVKGLVDSGITSIPPFFVHPPQSLSNTPTPTTPVSVTIPIIDLSGSDSDRRSTIVDQIREASSTFGFFQVINHGIPSDVLDRSISSIKAFNELPTETKSHYYNRELGKSVSFSSNYDLFQSKAASWRDTLQVILSPARLDTEMIPETCRREVVEWDWHGRGLGEKLMEILSEGLGLEGGKLKDLTCLEARVMLGHYYPYCPQPDLTIGIIPHTDPGVMTVVLQDQIGGLQVKHGDMWVDVKPLPGSLVVNIGDLLQIISNDEYKSAEHRVLANPNYEPRISIAYLFNPSKKEDFYGPLQELISPEKPALYQVLKFSEFERRFFTKDLDGKSLLGYFKL